MKIAAFLISSLTAENNNSGNESPNNNNSNGKSDVNSRFRTLRTVRASFVVRNDSGINSVHDLGAKSLLPLSSSTLRM
jgi:hypothetical protein